MSPKLQSHLSVQKVADEALVLDVNSGQIHQLNASAAWLLAQCDGNKPVEQLIEDFAAHFALDETTARRDVNAALAQLVELRIVTPDSP